MKNLLLFLLLVGSLTTIQAQTAKGTWMMGLHNFSAVPVVSDGVVTHLFPPTNSLGISFGKTKYKIEDEPQEDNTKNTVFGLSLNTHYFVADGLAVGLTGSFSSASSIYDEFGDEYKYSANMLLVGPELRYYVDAGTNTKFWMKGGASFGSISAKDDVEKEDPISLSQFGGGAGISYFPVQSVSIDFGIGYNVLKVKSDDDFFGDTEITTSGLAIDIGFGIFF